MEYRRSLDYLYGLQQFGIKLGLDNVRELLNRLGNPQDSLSVVHIAGTNGKGSTACALAALLGSGGLQVGLYTSPHLHSFTERIRVSGSPISKMDVAALTEELRQHADGIPITFFEFTTVLALVYFQRRKVDWVVLETGLGGRLDATNVVQPRLSLLTPIAADHQAYLGASLNEITAEKAGILKAGIPVLCATQQPAVLGLIEERAGQLQAPLLVSGQDWQVGASSPGTIDFSGGQWHLRDLPLPLAGAHQLENVGLALAAAECLSRENCLLDPETFLRALKSLRWPGRLEWWNGPSPVLLDGAHNAAGAQCLADYLAAKGLNDMTLVTGFKFDKAWMDIFALLKPFCRACYIAPLAEQPSVSGTEICENALTEGVPAQSFASVTEALQAGLAGSGRDGVLVAGSLFLVAEARSALLSWEGFQLVDPTGVW